MLPVNYINQLENYFLRTELTDEQYSQALPLIKKSITAIEKDPAFVVNSNNTFEMSTLSSPTKKLLLKNAVTIGNAFNIIVTFDGQFLTAVDKTNGESILTNANIIKATGSNSFNFEIILFSVCLLFFSAISIIIYRKTKVRGKLYE